MLGHLLRGGIPKNDDAMYMIGHSNKSVKFHMGIVVRQANPTSLDDFPFCTRIENTLYNLTKSINVT